MIREKDKRVNKRSAVIWIGAILFVLIILAFSASFFLGKWPFSSLLAYRTLRVDQVWANAARLDGRVIHVRGKLDVLTYRTLQMCCPPDCDCNQSGANYSLVSESEKVYNQGCSTQDSIELPLECKGDECSLTCSPFDPFQAEALELVGKLQVTYQDGKLCQLSLSEIQLAEALQQVGGEWHPVSLGTFTRPLGTPSISPSCALQPTQSP